MQGDAFTISEPVGPRDYIQPNLGHALRIWWAFFWRNTFISGALTILLGRIVRWTFENTFVNAKYLRPLNQFGGYLVSYIVAIFVIRIVLKRDFREFRIALLSGEGGPEAELLEPTFGRSLRVWWTYVWRTILLTALGYVFVMLPMGIFVGLFNPGPVVINIFSELLGLIIGGAVALFVIYSNILDEDFGEFRVSLLPPMENARATPAVETKPVGFS